LTLATQIALYFNQEFMPRRSVGLV
jgi:hypothetical protein